MKEEIKNNGVVENNTPKKVVRRITFWLKHANEEETLNTIINLSPKDLDETINICNTIIAKATEVRDNYDKIVLAKKMELLAKMQQEVDELKAKVGQD